MNNCRFYQSKEYPHGKRKKVGVVFFVGNLFSVSGVTSQLWLLARELADAGYSVFLFTYPPQDPAPPCQISATLANPLPHLIKVIRIEQRESSFAEAVKNLQHRFSVFFFLGIPYPYQLKILKDLGKKTVMRMTRYRHNDLLTLKNNPIYKDIFPYFSLIDRFIGISLPLCRSVEESGLDISRLVKIHNMVDTDFFSPLGADEKRALRLTLNIPADAFLIIFAGTFKRVKGVDIIFDAWETIKSKNDKAYLLLLGPLCSKCGGYEKFREEEKIASARIERTMGLLTGKFARMIQQHERMIFAGVQTNIRDYLRASDVLLFPSRQEGMPNVVMEAMACSLACITSAIEEITAELIPSQRFGLAVSGENPHDYARAVLKVMADGDLRKHLGKKARQRMQSEFSPSAIREMYCDLINDLSQP